MARHVLMLSRAMETLIVDALTLAENTHSPARLDHPHLTRTAHRATVRALVSRGLADWTTPDGRRVPHLTADGLTAARFLRAHPITTPDPADQEPPLRLEAINIGDELAFTTEDPASPRASRLRVSATVTRITGRSILLQGPAQAYRRPARYRITRAQLATRQVQRTRQVRRLPYTPDAARIITAPRAMWAVYIADPAQARDPYPALSGALTTTGQDVEVIATAQRHLLGEGSGFSGWLVHARRGDRYLAPVRRREQARRLLRDAVADHFA